MARNSMQKIGIAHTVNFNQSPLLCVWYSFEVCLALVKENCGVQKQLASGGGVKDEGGMVWGRHGRGGCRFLTAIRVSELYRTERCS